jgi:hypothetical protein
MGSEDTQRQEQIQDLKKLIETERDMNTDYLDSLNRLQLSEISILNVTIQELKKLAELKSSQLILSQKLLEINKVEIEALNQGESGPNTAQFVVLDDNGKVITTNKWNLTTGVKAKLIITKQEVMEK